MGDKKERLMAVVVGHGLDHVVTGERGSSRGWAAVAGGQDASAHRDQVRSEEHTRVLTGAVAQGLLDLGRVAMRQEAVGRYVGIDGAERCVLLSRPPRAADAGDEIDNQAARLHQPRGQQRGQT